MVVSSVGWRGAATTAAMDLIPRPPALYIHLNNPTTAAILTTITSDSSSSTSNSNGGDGGSGGGGSSVVYVGLKGQP